MSCTDPIADALTVIRNGLNAGKQTVSFPHSRIKEALCQVLVDEGYLIRCDVMETKPAGTISVGLKYAESGDPVMRTIQRISKPGCRRYMASEELKAPVINGFGIRVVSTSRGVLSDRVCRAQKIGGEVLCEIR
jgi:small subunit ribosomal protein S8